VTNIQQQRFYNEQLRREANIKRINLSQALEDIKVDIAFLNSRGSVSARLWGISR